MAMMSWIVSATVVFAFVVPIGVHAELRTATHPKELKAGADISMCHGQSGWQITFEDEFEGTQLNTSNWRPDNNFTAPGAKELYMADAISVHNGSMIITTSKADLIGPHGTHYSYASGWVSSRAKQFQKFGRFEVRAKMPSFAARNPGHGKKAEAQGWPAHWMMPNPSTSNPPHVCWPVGGEIDILEMMGGTDILGWEKMDMTYHWAKECGKDEWGAHRKTQGHMTKPKKFWTEEFHTYGIEWDATSIKWFVDGKKHNEIKAGTVPTLFIPQDPFYMILNTALQRNAEPDDKGFPIYQTIDRVTWCKKV